MKTTLYSKYLVAAISLAGILVAMTVTADSAFAQPRRAAQDRHLAQRHDRHDKVVVSLPKDRRAVSVGRARYFYHRGTFYRKAPAGYVVVNAPLGAVVTGLPVGFKMTVIGGMTHFTYGGVYYRRVPSGYRVVAPPPAIRVQAPSYGCAQLPVPDEQIAVIAERLNVRSGPGVSQAVVGQVVRGTRLVILGNAAGWWYVQLPDGDTGWVMAAFTTSLPQPASG
ncbi:MAG: DUF6515 family protein [Desulfobacterales bacterium]